MKSTDLVRGKLYYVRYWDDIESQELVYVETFRGFHIFICPMTSIEFKVRPSSAQIRRA